MRVLAFVDSDSYIKWGAALLGQLPAGWERELVVVATTVAPSRAQLSTALQGSGFDESQVDTIPLSAVVATVDAVRPDAVLVAMRGPAASVIMRAVAGCTPRPVIVSGLPGISIPATAKALYYRDLADLMVLHSKREIREFTALARERGWTHRLALATLPFLDTSAVRGGNDLVFAAQAIVPRTRRERHRLLDTLINTAYANPGHRVVIKVRATTGEQQTHAEAHSYAELLATRDVVPSNLVVGGGSMADALNTSCGLVTVSSTAAIEAAARGLPVLALDTFGISPQLINTVFLGSGLFGGAAECTAIALRTADSEWSDDNYLHDSNDNDWVRTLRSLAQSRRDGQLPAPSPIRSEVGGELRRAWDRKRAFGDHDDSTIGIIAIVVGMPAYLLVRTANRLRRKTERRSVARRRAAEERTRRTGS